MLATFIALIIILSIPIWGYAILKNKFVNPTLVGWCTAVAFDWLIFFFVKATPIALMFLYIASTFLALKIVVANNHLNKKEQLNFTQWCLFNYCWFGMNPAPFKTFPAKTLPDYPAYFTKGISRIVIGLIIIFIANQLSPLLSGSIVDFLPGLFYLIALSFILHFGILNISTGFLRLQGINVTSLFKDPLKSKSLSEFWSRRWNLAFVELTTIAVLRPLKKRYGANIAFWGAYVFSGLLHELAISLPVKTGFGKPFLYFIIQAVLILVFEKQLMKLSLSSFVKKCWLLACLFIPIFLLFHKAFITDIVLPLVGYLRL